MNAASFRKNMGVSELQYSVLQNMENGEIRRREARSFIVSLHALVKRGMLEYVPMKTGDHLDDRWRLTARGHDLVRSWSMI